MTTKHAFMAKAIAGIGRFAPVAGRLPLVTTFPEMILIMTSGAILAILRLEISAEPGEAQRFYEIRISHLPLPSLVHWPGRLQALRWRP